MEFKVDDSKLYSETTMLFTGIILLFILFLIGYLLLYLLSGG